MKPQDPRPILANAVRKAVKPYASKLKQFFDELPEHHEKINRWSATRAEEDWYDLHDRASHGDKEAQKTLEQLPLADYRSWVKRYGTLEQVHWSTYDNWHKGFNATFLDAAKDILEEANKVAEFAQRQLDELHEMVGEPATPSAFVGGELNHVRVLCENIIHDRADKDPTFLKAYL